MAEEKSNGGPLQLIFIFLGILAALIVFWFYTGGPERADLRGIFLNPPAPLDSGDAYGPQTGEPAPWAPSSTQIQ